MDELEEMTTKLIIEVEMKGQVRSVGGRYRHRFPSWVGGSRCPSLPDAPELEASSGRATGWIWVPSRRWISASST